MNKSTLFCLLLIATLPVGCSNYATSQKRVPSFEYLSIYSSRYADAESIVKFPSPEFPKSISKKAIKDKIELQSELQLDYFETRYFKDEVSVDIYDVYGMPDTFIGVPEGSCDILIITL